MQLRDQIIVITGGANGIGRAMARRFAAESPTAIVIADLQQAAADSTAKEIAGMKDGKVAVHAVGCDVRREADVQQLVQFTVSRYGRVDLFVSNAGTTVKGDCQVSDEDWQQVWQVNVMGHVYAARAVIPQMLSQGSGYWLTTASAAGLLTEIGSAPYSVSKHAAVALTEWMSVQYQRQGLKFSCLCPAGVQTGFLDLEDPIHQFLHMSSVTPEFTAECVIDGLATERFLILPHPEVAEFFRFKTENYEAWLKNFSRVKQRLDQLAKKRAGS